MQDVAILNRDWLLIGRQVRTAFEKLSINARFFAAFEDGGNRYLSRAWMIGPD